MSFVGHATRSLFPREARAPRRRRVKSGAGLSALLTLACALTPLAAMVEAMRLTA